MQPCSSPSQPRSKGTFCAGEIIIVLAGVALSALVAWQAVRYYRGEIIAPGVDLLFDAVPRSTNRESANWPLPSVVDGILKSVHMITGVGVWLLLSVTAMHVSAMLGRILGVGFTAYRKEHCAPGSGSMPRREDAELKQRAVVAADHREGAAKRWSGASPGVITELTIALLGLGLLGWIGFAILVAAQKIEAYRASLGIEWKEIGDAVVVGVACATWALASLSYIVRTVRSQGEGRDE